MNESTAPAVATEAPAAVPTKKVATKKPTPSKKPAAKTVSEKKAAPEKPSTESEIRWTEKKLTLLRTLVKAGATNAMSAISPEKIATLSKGKALTNLSPSFDITVQGYIAVAVLEESREHLRYITPKGVKFLKSQEGK